MNEFQPFHGGQFMLPDTIQYHGAHYIPEMSSPNYSGSYTNLVSHVPYSNSTGNGSQLGLTNTSETQQTDFNGKYSMVSTPGSSSSSDSSSSQESSCNSAKKKERKGN